MEYADFPGGEKRQPLEARAPDKAPILNRFWGITGADHREKTVLRVLCVLRGELPFFAADDSLFQPALLRPPLPLDDSSGKSHEYQGL